VFFHILKSVLPFRRNSALTPQSAIEHNFISKNTSRKLLAKDVEKSVNSIVKNKKENEKGKPSRFRFK
jgi:hypothetical protein